MNIVIFEGIDKVGKTTLKDQFEKATNYEHLCIDRHIISYCAYDIIFRYKTIDDIRPKLQMFVNEAMNSDIQYNLVLASASDSVIKQNCYNSNHQQYDTYEHTNVFTKVISELLTLSKGCINYYESQLDPRFSVFNRVDNLLQQMTLGG